MKRELLAPKRALRSGSRKVICSSSSLRLDHLDKQRKAAFKAKSDMPKLNFLKIVKKSDPVLEGENESRIPGTMKKQLPDPRLCSTQTVFYGH